jgi:hypothetical protein
MNNRSSRAITGKSNRDTSRPLDNTYPQSGITARSSFATGAYTIQANNGNLPRPFTPEVRIFDNHKKNPPVLPKSRESIIPPDNDHKRSMLYPMTCPQSWIDKNQKADVFEKAGFNISIDDKVRKHYCKEFCERNRDQLWKYDHAYVGKTPRTVYKEITTDYFLHSKITDLYYKEKLLKHQSSDRLRLCMVDEHLGTPVMPEVRDTFSVSLKTTRSEKALKMTNVLQPGIKEMNEEPATRHRRGYNHEPEFGTFTALSRVLKRNEDAACKR